MPNKLLLEQQLNYDGDMEDWMTQKQGGVSQVVVGENGLSESILSGPTDMQGNRGKGVDMNIDR